MRKLISVSLLLCITALSWAQVPHNETGWLPEKENHLVYDYCNILSQEQIDTLEERLLIVNDSTSNQIVVMFTPGFGGRDISSFAFEVGEKWGIGQASLSNGVLIVVKPKDSTSGEVEIATGEGLEGVLPDIFCKRIIEDIMIPRFREDDYYGAVTAALDVIEPVCAGEYSFEQYKEDHKGNGSGLIVLAVVAGGCALMYRQFKKHPPKNTGGDFSGGSYSSDTSWSSTSWSDSSSSSSGGFGGFGGGHFGGGGASGKW